MGFRACGKTLDGREDVSGHGFIRAARPLRMNNSALSKASAQRSGAPKESLFPQPLQPRWALQRLSSCLLYSLSQGAFSMQPAPVDINALKNRMRDTWMAGDFGVIAAYTAEAAKDFADRLGIAPGTRVLDVARGTGNTAIPIARAGATVTGVDIASNLLEQARTRAAKEGVKATFEEGDAEQLKFPDGSFDAIVSMFGAMFAPRPERVAAEFLRVCRPGGLIAMANWTPGGFVGESFRTMALHVPPPPDIPAPAL